MKKLKVGILFGGRSGEHEVSITSALSVYKALDKNKYDVSLIGIDKTGRWVWANQAEMLLQSENPRLIALNKIKETVTLLPYTTEKQLVAMGSEPTLAAPASFDVILPIIHGTFGEDGTLQGLLELANIPYVGSGVVGSSVGMDKDVSRRLLAQAGIPVVETHVLRKNDFLKSPQKHIQVLIEKLGLPFFVKPSNSGSSVGVFKVKSKDQAESLISQAFQYDVKVLAEKAIEARELEISILGNDEPKASIIGEIIPTHEFYSYEAKYMDENGAHLKIPAESLSNDLQKTMTDIALKAFQVLELKGLSRIDFFLDKKTHQLYLNEVNTIPGFTSISMYPKLWAASGLPYSALLDQLIQLAIDLHVEKSKLKRSFEN